MIKILAAFAILTVMVSIASVYNLKQATYNLEEYKRDISAKILKDREAIKVLKAEMAYLSRPKRLERLSRRHLVLEATGNEQLVSGFEDLAIREGVQMVNLPIDNFQLLLPRQKPTPIKVARSVAKPSFQGNIKTVTTTIANVVKEEKIRPEYKLVEKSLYDRILAKIGN